VPADAHKGDRGHLAVFAGSPGTTGAAWLASHAAARARVGLVSLYLDESTWPVLASRCTSVMAKPWDAAAGSSGIPDPSRWTGLLVGPGWGLGPERLAALDRLLALGLPGVLDADGLALLGKLPGGARGRLAGRWVLTPHPGEFSRLSGISVTELLDDPLPRAAALAADLEAIVVLKGSVTSISVPDGRCWILDGGNPALATGGSGDVLAGLVAGGIASGLDPLEAAQFGVSLHARLGRIAARRSGWFLAEDLVPLVSAMLGRQRGRGCSGE
jgi:NAD(P)H-hydrate epimerase